VQCQLRKQHIKLTRPESLGAIENMQAAFPVFCTVHLFLFFGEPDFKQPVSSRSAGKIRAIPNFQSKILTDVFGSHVLIHMRVAAFDEVRMGKLKFFFDMSVLCLDRAEARVL